MDKTNEQLHEDFEQALINLRDKLSDLLHYGNYAIEHFCRDWDGKRLASATMRVGDHRILMQATTPATSYKQGTEVTILLPEENPVNEELLESWDKQLIQRDIDYHQKELDKLKKRKEELLSE